MSDEAAYFRKPALVEADGLYTSVVEFPKGDPNKYAVVLEHRASGLKLYFFANSAIMKEILMTMLDALDAEGEA